MMYVVDKGKRKERWEVAYGLAKKSRVAGQPKSMQTELINHVRQSC